jgi:biotin-(acetyl-CoA carboxylase) ligase
VTGTSWDRAKLLANVLNAMERDYETFEAAGFAELRNRYEGRLTLLGRKVRFERDGRAVVASVDGVDDDGALRVVPEGEDRPLSLYGEHVEPAA